jgi:NAD+ kinase
MSRVVFLVNDRKEAALDLAAETAAVLRENGVELFLPADSPDSLGYSGTNLDKLVEDLRASRMSAWPQLAVIFGGDGTFISAARVLSPFGIAIVGINLGHLGFLMSLEVEEMPQNLLRLVQGEYYLEPRTQIVGELIRGGQQIAVAVAQNDIVINNGSVSRMIGMAVSVDDNRALEMKGDGVIVATPTGSTAYSLSAGGSIVLPETDVMLITPVAAHNLYSRPLVVSADSEIHISFSSVSPTAKMAFDGQQFYDVMNDDEVIIRKYRHSAVFVWPEQGMFFKKLKAKLMSS